MTVEDISSVYISSPKAMKERYCAKRLMHTYFLKCKEVVWEKFVFTRALPLFFVRMFE